MSEEQVQQSVRAIYISDIKQHQSKAIATVGVSGTGFFSTGFFPAWSASWCVCCALAVGGIGYALYHLNSALEKRTEFNAAKWVRDSVVKATRKEAQDASDV